MEIEVHPAACRAGRAKNHRAMPSCCVPQIAYDAVMATQTLMTAEQFDQLPAEEERYELLDGELIEMPSATYRHNRISVILSTSLKNYLSASHSGEVVPDTEFAVGANTRLRPDLAVLGAEKWARADQDKVPVTVMPDIAVEIVSPSDSASKLESKVERYLAAGVVEVWIIYPVQQHVYVHNSSVVSKLASTGRLSSPLLTGWSIAVSDLFAS